MYSIKRISLLKLSILFVLFHLNTTVTYATRAIPDDNLAYPVLVTYGTKSGSGFYLSTKENVFFITARHILFKQAKAKDKIDYLLENKNLKLLSYPIDPKDQGRIILDLDLKTLNNSKNLKFHKDHDVAVVRIALMPKEEGQTNLILINGAHLKEMAGSGILGVKLDTIKKFDAVLISNDVFIFGYPKSIGMKNIPQIESDRPLLRKGIVAGINRHKKTIILDCPTYPGNSGGPVLEVDQKGFKVHYRIIGVLSQFIPFAEKRINKQMPHANFGYSVATPMDPVLELISDLEKHHSSK
jgi:hypothetical protein